MVENSLLLLLSNVLYMQLNACVVYLVNNTDKLDGESNK